MNRQTPSARVLVIGVGSLDRGDDAVGRRVATRLASHAPVGIGVMESRGDAAALMHAWAGTDGVVIVDAARTGARPGTFSRLDASAGPLPAETARSSTHDMGVADAIELARAMGDLPDRVVVIAVEAGSFTHGMDLSPDVERAVDAIVCAVAQEASGLLEELGSHA